MRLSSVSTRARSCSLWMLHPSGMSEATWSVINVITCVACIWSDASAGRLCLKLSSGVWVCNKFSWRLADYEIKTGRVVYMMWFPLFCFDFSWYFASSHGVQQLTCCWPLDGLDSGLTTSNYKELAEIYSKYKDQGKCCLQSQSVVPWGGNLAILWWLTFHDAHFLSNYSNFL